MTRKQLENTVDYLRHIKSDSKSLILDNAIYGGYDKEEVGEAIEEYKSLDYVEQLLIMEMDKSTRTTNDKCPF